MAEQSTNQQYPSGQPPYQRPSDMPKTLYRASEPQLSLDDLTPQEHIMNWLWPIASWTLMLMNILGFVMAVRDMWGDKYNPISHYLATGASALTLFMLAGIYKLILRGK